MGNESSKDTATTLGFQAHFRLLRHRTTNETLETTGHNVHDATRLTKTPITSGGVKTHAYSRSGNSLLPLSNPGYGVKTQLQASSQRSVPDFSHGTKTPLDNPLQTPSGEFKAQQLPKTIWAGNHSCKVVQHLGGTYSTGVLPMDWQQKDWSPMDHSTDTKALGRRMGSMGTSQPRVTRPWYLHH
jgi:hypothetical protein